MGNYILLCHGAQKEFSSCNVPNGSNVIYWSAFGYALNAGIAWTLVSQIRRNPMDLESIPRMGKGIEVHILKGGQSYQPDIYLSGDNNLLCVLINMNNSTYACLGNSFSTTLNQFIQQFPNDLLHLLCCTGDQPSPNLKLLDGLTQTDQNQVIGGMRRWGSQPATDSATGDNYSIVLSGETYSLLEIPPESSKAVLAGKKAILENLRLDNLVTGLNRAAGLVYVAQNGVAGFGSLMAAMTGLSDGIIKAASDASLTLSGFADESKTILSHLKRSMTFLLKGHEDLAVKFLTKCASSAQEMSTQSSKLADRFDKLGDQAIEVLKNTQVEQGCQHDKIEEERRKIAQLQADTAEAKTLSEQLATQRVELKTMYEDAKAKEDKAADRAFALQIVGAIFGAIGSGLNSFAGGMKPGSSAPPPTKSPAAKPTPPTKSGDTKGSGDAKGSDAKKSDSEKETEAAAHGSAEASNSISDSTDKIASSQEDAGQSYRQEKMKYLDKLLEVEDKQRKALADIAKYAELLKSSAQEKQIAETTAAALHQAVGALKSIASTLRDNSFFWQLMAQACQKLAAPEFLEVITGVKDFPLEERLETYLEDNFKVELITYYAQWQALNLVCNEYSAAVFEARAQMLADFQKNPTIEEAQKQAPVLAAQLLADTEADLKKLDERRAAIDIEKKVLSGAGTATV